MTQYSVLVCAHDQWYSQGQWTNKISLVQKCEVNGHCQSMPWIRWLQFHTVLKRMTRSGSLPSKVELLGMYGWRPKPQVTVVHSYTVLKKTLSIKHQHQHSPVCHHWACDPEDGFQLQSPQAVSTVSQSEQCYRCSFRYHKANRATIWIHTSSYS